MPNTLAALLHHSLDFAGVFPPASLPVPEALQVFNGERKSDSAGMLARFVSPISRLEELVACHRAHHSGTALVVSVLPRGGRTTGEFLAGLEADLTTIQRIRAEHFGHLRIDTIETRVPPEACTPSALRRLLAAVDALVARHEDAAKLVFFEIAPSPALPELVAVLAEHAAATQRPAAPVLGYKLRTGGSGSVIAPTPELVALAMSSAATHGVPMKCTGGLHRPLRAIDNGTGSHGFINLLVAAALAEQVEGAPSDLLDLLGESAPEAFSFEPSVVRWRGHEIPLSAVVRARRRLLVGFGSCYVETPREELQKLGWWPGTRYTADSTH